MKRTAVGAGVYQSEDGVFYARYARSFVNKFWVRARNIYLDAKSLVAKPAKLKTARLRFGT